MFTAHSITEMSAHLYQLAASQMTVDGLNSDEEEKILRMAEMILQRRMKAINGYEFSAPKVVADFCQMRIGQEAREHFLVLFLDAQHRLIADEVLFSGTIDQASVHPRVIVQQALQHNAAAVILAHNHPSGKLVPSRADELLTTQLKQSLSTIDVRVLDHIIVGPDPSEYHSFAASGQL